MTALHRPLIAIDLGRRRVGVAVTDAGGRVAVPLTVLDGRDRRALIDQLGQLATERGADFVLGLPRMIDGEERRPARDARAFARTLERATGRAVALQDETLSSAEASERARAAGRAPSEPIDDLAAALILEEYLGGLREV